MTGERPLAVWLDPDAPNRVIELWPEALTHIRSRSGREALATHAIRRVVTDPDIRTPDPRPGRERFYKRGVGPTTWLRVVVDWSGRRGRVKTVIPERRLPKRDRR